MKTILFRTSSLLLLCAFFLSFWVIGQYYYSEISLQERRNRMILVRSMIEEYIEQNGSKPLDKEYEGKILSWRAVLLNELHSTSPGIISQHTTLNQIKFPLDNNSLQPNIYGNGHLSVFYIHAQGKTSKNTLREEDEGYIIAEVGDVFLEPLPWSTPLDLVCNESGLFLMEGEKVLQEVTFRNGIYILKSDGSIGYVASPISIANLLNAM